MLRAALGALVLLHGIAKLRHGLGDVATAMARFHIPAAVGYLVYVGEVVAPTLMIAGLWTRAAAAVLAVNMAVALALGHPGELFQATAHGGLFLEVQWMFLLAAIAVALLGAGRYAAAGAGGRWN